uniref:Williams-Beuren syndrome chromosomal region 27 protein-like n=1 Tax=Phallusia mammillata TaxID=59560 RepID=A0A6F9DW44_9ASCI|nr:Williams-Beuren syndrome chromosomal region 27 protein-like [Phallusia mammillata]
MPLDLEKAKLAWNQIYGGMLESETEKGIVKNYSKHAAAYDQCLQDIGYNIPTTVAELVMKYGNLGSNSQVLDVGVGTGLLGEELNKLGFSGKLDGIDGSEGMLNVAKNKGIYRDLIQQFLTPGCTLDVGDVKYDAIACVGTFSSSHVAPSVAKCFFKHVKTGAPVIISARLFENSTEDSKFLAELRCMFQEICYSGEALLLCEHPTNYYGVNFFTNENDPSKPCPGACFCLAKT